MWQCQRNRQKAAYRAQSKACSVSGKKFENTGVCVEDLISIGTIGLIKGINTFNPEKKIKLATYASRCIEMRFLCICAATTE